VKKCLEQLHPQTILTENQMQVGVEIASNCGRIILPVGNRQFYAGVGSNL
jgi:hypothetical protein